MTAPRVFSPHQPKWQRFQGTLLVPSNQVGNKNQQQHTYQRQYSHVYHQRLAMLGPRCWDSVKDVGDATKVKRVLELREDIDSIIVGTLVKELSTEQDSIHPDVPHCHSKDELYLEDESGRVTLAMDDMHAYCTGVVAGVRGILQPDGVLTVTQVYAPAPPKPLPAADTGTTTTSADSSPYLLLLSGLQCGGPDVSSVPREMLLCFLQGRFGTDLAKQVGHVVIAGGLITSASPEQPRTPALRDLDAFLLQLSATGLPIDVLPGQSDPTTANWPQRPLHSALLPRSGARLNRTPNPYAAVHAGRLVIGTDGRNVADITQRMLSSGKNEKEPVSELEALERTMEWSHICPTGPDSVPTVPHAETDPMVLTQLPNIYFMGNAKKFATSQKGDTRFLCLPTFGSSGQAVLVHLGTLAVQCLKFEDD